MYTWQLMDCFNNWYIDFCILRQYVHSVKLWNWSRYTFYSKSIINFVSYVNHCFICQGLSSYPGLTARQSVFKKLEKLKSSSSLSFICYTRNWVNTLNLAVLEAIRLFLAILDISQMWSMKAMQIPKTGTGPTNTFDFSKFLFVIPWEI